MDPSPSSSREGRGSESIAKVPHTIYVSGHYIGGCEDLENAYKSGKLQKLIDKANHDNKLENMVIGRTWENYGTKEWHEGADKVIKKMEEFE